MMAGVVGALHVIGFGLLLVLVAPARRAAAARSRWASA